MTNSLSPSATPSRDVRHSRPPRAVTADPIAFFDVGAVNREVDAAASMGRVLASKHYVLGQEVKGFEDAFARYIGVAECVGVGNGTDALELGLRALDVGPGSRVLMVANAAFYGSTAAYAVGATPVYVDVEATTACMDPNKLAEALAKDVSYACIIVTHLYGQIAQMPAIMALADAYGVPVLEDCAQAHGAAIEGRRAGSWGALASFSFYPTKNLGALGDGGAVVSDDLQLARRVRALRQYGWSAKYVIAHVGGRNSRLDEMQAAVLRDKLPHLDAQNGRRQAVARAYNGAFADLPLELPLADGNAAVAHLYVLRTENRDQLAEDLAGHGIQTAVHYPHPDHLQPAYDCPQKLGSLPVTESLAHTVLSLPCHPGLSDSAVNQVIHSVRSCVAKPGRVSF